MIFRIQPFATNKLDFGKVYNDHCAAVPPSYEWIQIMDWDAMVVCFEAYNVMEKAIALYPSTDIFGAVTNRVGFAHQRFGEIMSEEYDFKHHQNIGKSLAKTFSDGVCLKSWTIAGFFMLFRKSYWEKNPFQELIVNEKGRHFDKTFCQGATEMRVIQGVYVFHQYRMGKDWKDNSHLKLFSGKDPHNLANTPQS